MFDYLGSFFILSMSWMINKKKSWKPAYHEILDKTNVEQEQIKRQMTDIIMLTKLHDHQP